MVYIKKGEKLKGEKSSLSLRSSFVIFTSTLLDIKCTPTMLNVKIVMIHGGSVTRQNLSTR
jgi:hypothetical protein